MCYVSLNIHMKFRYEINRTGFQIRIRNRQTFYCLQKSPKGYWKAEKTGLKDCRLLAPIFFYILDFPFIKFSNTKQSLANGLSDLYGWDSFIFINQSFQSSSTAPPLARMASQVSTNSSKQTDQGSTNVHIEECEDFRQNATQKRFKNIESFSPPSSRVPSELLCCPKLLCALNWHIHKRTTNTCHVDGEGWCLVHFGKMLLK